MCKEMITRMDLCKTRTVMQKYDKYNKCKWHMRFKPNHINTHQNSDN